MAFVDGPGAMRLPERGIPRQAALVFYDEDVRGVRDILAGVLRECRGRGAAFITSDDRWIWTEGELGRFRRQDVMGYVVTSAGSVAVRAIVEAPGDTLLVEAAGSGGWLTIVFDDRATIGAVRVASARATATLSRILTDMAERRREAEAWREIGGPPGPPPLFA